MALYLLNKLPSLEQNVQKISECCEHTLDKIETSRWKNILLKMHHNWKTRSQLSNLTEAQLKDVGLTKLDVYRECGKSIWK